MEEKKKWISYSDRMATKKYYVLLEDKDVLGVFSTLRKACEFMTGKKFPSYWTLVRKKTNKFEIGNYSLQIVKPK
jgi:hypothetical protein